MSKAIQNPQVQFSIDFTYWENKIILTSWAGFQNRTGAYGGLDSEEPSDGTCLLNINTENTQEISTAQLNAIEYLLANQELIRDKLLVTLLALFHYLKQGSTDEDYLTEEELKEYFPPVQSVSDLTNLMGLHCVHVLDVEKDGFAYVGFEFGCCWDPEHGGGVMTHKDRIIGNGGGADTAFEVWEAREDSQKTKPNQIMIFKTNLNCGNCVAKVTPFLNETVGDGKWSVDLNSPERFLTVEKDLDPEIIHKGIENFGFEAELVS